MILKNSVLTLSLLITFLCRSTVFQPTKAETTLYKNVCCLLEKPKILARMLRVNLT